MPFPRRFRRRGALLGALVVVLTCAALDVQVSGAESSFTRTSGRPFATNSAWNTPIVANPALDARSNSQVAYLADSTHPGIANIGAYGVPVWDADASARPAASRPRPALARAPALTPGDSPEASPGTAE